MKKSNYKQYISQLSIDCVIFGFKDKELKVLISKFNFGKSLWTLPGGYVLKTESVDNAASRILKERTHLKDIYLEQFRVFGNENRIVNDKLKPIVQKEFSKLFDAETIKWMTSRFVCIGYYALVDISNVNPQKVDLDELLEWRSIHDIPKMMYDHNEIISAALEALRQNLDQKLIGFNLLPETFTMKEVQEVYEAVYSRSFPNNNFQKKILDLQVLERLEKKFTGAQNKAPYLYRMKLKKDK